MAFLRYWYTAYDNALPCEAALLVCCSPGQIRSRLAASVRPSPFWRSFGKTQIRFPAVRLRLSWSKIACPSRHPRLTLRHSLSPQQLWVSFEQEPPTTVSSDGYTSILYLLEFDVVPRHSSRGPNRRKCYV